MDIAQEQILVEPYQYILQVPGKQVREKLIQAFNVWLMIPDENLLIISDVVKMLHNSSLMIDDIEDNSKLRRGIPVAHNIFGVAQTINSANYIYFKALEKVLSLKNPRCINIFTVCFNKSDEEIVAVLFTCVLKKGFVIKKFVGDGSPMKIFGISFWYLECLHGSCKQPLPVLRQDLIRYFMHLIIEELLELHRGQGMDIYWRDSFTCPTEEEYKEMVRKKTGGLFRVAVRLMQLFTQNTSDFLPLLDTLSLFFQIRDDYANLQSDEYKENKSYCEDLTEGKFSFPIIHGIRQDPSSTKIINILKQHTEDDDMKKYCVDCLEQCGSFAYTRTVLKELEQRALQLIGDLGGNEHLTLVVHQLSKLYSD